MRGDVQENIGLRLPIHRLTELEHNRFAVHMDSSVPRTGHNLFVHHFRFELQLTDAGVSPGAGRTQRA